MRIIISGDILRSLGIKYFPFHLDLKGPCATATLGLFSALGQRVSSKVLLVPFSVTGMVCGLDS